MQRNLNDYFAVYRRCAEKACGPQKIRLWWVVIKSTFSHHFSALRVTFLHFAFFIPEFDSGHHIYKFVFMQYDMLTWPEAEIYCRDREGGHLTSVRNLKESKYIEKNLRMLRYYFGLSKLWIGASDLYNEGYFKWTDGRPFAYQHWIQGEPSGHHRGMKEDCAVMTADPHWARWKDEYCLHHLPFICKIRGKMFGSWIFQARGRSEDVWIIY